MIAKVGWSIWPLLLGVTVLVGNPVNLSAFSFGIDINADLIIPQWTVGSNIGPISRSASFSEDYLIDVTAPDVPNGTSGFLYFNVNLNSTTFSGSPASEYMSSFADVTAPFFLSTDPFLPQGSCGACAIPVIFGTAQDITISATAYSSYSYGYNPNVSVAPYLAGQTIHSSVTLSGPEIYAVDHQTGTGSLVSDAVVTEGSEVTESPEPSTVALLSGGLYLLTLIRSRRRLTGTASGNRV
jgi:hypothetical protein